MNHDTWPAPKPTDRHYVPPVQLPICTALWAMYLVGDLNEAPPAGHGRSLSAVA